MVGGLGMQLTFCSSANVTPACRLMLNRVSPCCTVYTTQPLRKVQGVPPGVTSATVVPGSGGNGTAVTTDAFVGKMPVGGGSEGTGGPDVTAGNSGTRVKVAVGVSLGVGVSVTVGVFVFVDVIVSVAVAARVAACVAAAVAGFVTVLGFGGAGVCGGGCPAGGFPLGNLRARFWALSLRNLGAVSGCWTTVAAGGPSPFCC